MSMSVTFSELLRAGVAASLLALPMSAGASVILTTPVYTQDFNTLAANSTSSTLPAGWSIAEAGANANTSYAPNTGSTATGNTYSFGASGSTERALGGVASANLTPYRFGVQLTNGLGRAITSLDIGYFGELWRTGTSGNTNALNFSWSLNATSLTTGTYTDFTALDYVVTPTGVTGAMDGNLNRSFVSATLLGLNLPAGESIFLRWTGIDRAGNDHGMAIDDVRISGMTAVPEPASWAMLIAGFGLVGAMARRKRQFAATSV